MCIFGSRKMMCDGPSILLIDVSVITHKSGRQRIIISKIKDDGKSSLEKMEQKDFDA